MIVAGLGAILVAHGGIVIFPIVAWCVGIPLGLHARSCAMDYRDTGDLSSRRRASIAGWLIFGLCGLMAGFVVWADVPWRHGYIKMSDVPALLINAALMFTVWFGPPTLLGLSAIRMLKKSKDRQNQFICRKCGYDNRGTIRGVCPECGSTLNVGLDGNQTS